MKRESEIRRDQKRETDSNEKKKEIKKSQDIEMSIYYHITNACLAMFSFPLPSIFT